MTRVFVIGVVSLLWVSPVSAQDSACTYDRCAIRLSGGRLVQGMTAVRIARIGLYPPRIDLLANADDSTRFHYQAFRKYHTRSASLGLVGLALAAAGAALVAGTNKDATQWTGVGLTAVGFGFSLGARSSGRRGWNELSQAVWFYNRRFAH